jgi:hypothetical protein
MKKSAESRHGYPPDPLIDEVRAIRKQIWDGYGNDLKTGVADLRRLQKALGVKVVSLSLRRVKKRRKAS